jgi:hypothetical protein
MIVLMEKQDLPNPTADDVEKFKYLSPMLDSALQEMREFAKKKQDGIVSTAKIKILNRLLIELKRVLAREESAGYLDSLSEEQLPQNSDAVLILGQYRAALDSFKEKYCRWDGGTHIWFTREHIEGDMDAEVESGDDSAEEEDDQEDKSEGNE